MDLNLNEQRALRCLAGADGWMRRRDLYRATFQRLPVKERGVIIPRLVELELVEQREVLAANSRAALEVCLTAKGKAEVRRRRRAGLMA